MDDRILIGILGALLGYLINNFLNIDRDKRKEFNDATEKIKEIIKQNITTIYDLGGEELIEIPINEIDKIAEHFTLLQKRKFIKHAQCYIDHQNKCRDKNEPHYQMIHSSEIALSLKNLLKLLKRK